MTTRRGSSPALLVVSIVSLGAAITQSLLLVRLLVTRKAAAPSPRATPSPSPWSGSAAGTTQRPHLPPQDPHSPPTATARGTYVPRQQGFPEDRPETDPHSPPTGPILVNHVPPRTSAPNSSRS